MTKCFIKINNKIELAKLEENKNILPEKTSEYLVKYN